MHPQIPSFSLPNPSTPNAFAAILLLPLIPLLLFFIGARALPSTPDGGFGGSDSPFSLGEVYTTAAFVSVAGVTVLMLAVWPDMGRQVSGWVGYRYDAVDVDSVGAVQGSGYAMKFGRKGPRGEGKLRTATMVEQSQGRGGYGLKQGQEEVRVGRSGRGTRMMQQGPAGRQEQVVVDGRVTNTGLFVDETVTTVPIPTTQAGRAQLRTQLIRAQFPRAYSPYRPHTLTAILLCGLFVALVVVTSQKIMTKVYAIEGPSSSTSSSNRSRTSGSSKDKDKERKREKEHKDAAKMTPWVMSEIKHRQAEKDDENATLARVAKDAEKERTKLKGVQEKVSKKEFDEYRNDKAKERSAEIDVLRKQLTKLGLPLVGIPEKKEEAAEERDAEGEEGGGETTKFGKLKDTVSNWFDLDPTKKKQKEDKPKEPSIPVKEKVKQFLFLDAYDDEAATHNKAKAEVEAYKEQVKAQTIADLEAKDAEIEAARQINASAANAEALARRMKAG